MLLIKVSECCWKVAKFPKILIKIKTFYEGQTASRFKEVINSGLKCYFSFRIFCTRPENNFRPNFGVPLTVSFSVETCCNVYKHYSLLHLFNSTSEYGMMLQLVLVIPFDK